MKLTIEQVSKLTKLSIPTLRVYVSRQKLGTKVGNNRVFSQSDVEKLLKKSKGSTKNSKGKRKANAASSAKKGTQVRASKQSTIKTRVSVTRVESPMPKSEKRSFWQSIFVTRKPKQKVKLLEAKTTR